MRPEKKVMVDTLTEKLSGVCSFILADYRGLKAQEINELRRMLIKEEAELMVVSNRMFILALRNADLGGLNEYVVGPTAVAFAGQDAVKVAKILYDFSREHKELKLKGGFLDNATLSGDQVEQVAKLPTRRELLARLAGQMSGLLSGLVIVMSGPARGFVTILGKLEERQVTSEGN